LTSVTPVVVDVKGRRIPAKMGQGKITTYSWLSQAKLFQDDIPGRVRLSREQRELYEQLKNLS